MTALYADENMPVEAVTALRRLGHDVLTAQEAGQANQSIDDEAVLSFAATRQRAVLALNLWRFVALHSEKRDHAGIIVCSPDADVEAQARRIDETIRQEGDLGGKLLRVRRLPR